MKFLSSHRVDSYYYGDITPYITRKKKEFCALFEEIRLRNEQSLCIFMAKNVKNRVFFQFLTAPHTLI